MGVPPNSPTAKKLAERMRRDLRNFKEGEQFYSQRKAVTRYGTNTLMAYAALRMLYDDGLLDVVSGRGFFVAKGRHGKA